nr:MAG TPA: hypothetical protein [Caudoviricetes sp.]
MHNSEINWLEQIMFICIFFQIYIIVPIEQGLI